MKRQALGSMIVPLAFVLLSASASAQWINVTIEGTPRTPDGKPNLLAAAPRTADGKLDLSGIWRVHDEDGPPKYALNLAADLPDQRVPLQPWAEVLMKEREANLGKDYPATRCLPPGVPNLTMAPHPFKIVQTRGLVVILYEALNTYRQIHTDGRALPRDPNPTWMGYSIGNWEGDTFVVRTTGFNDKTWIDVAGHPNTEALQVIERFRRRDFGHMDIEITIDDAKAYTKPWTVTIASVLVPDTELLEFVCTENEKDQSHMVGK
jgi:hypothetical protein